VLRSTGRKPSIKVHINQTYAYLDSITFIASSLPHRPNCWKDCNQREKKKKNKRPNIAGPSLVFFGTGLSGEAQWASTSSLRGGFRYVRCHIIRENLHAFSIRGLRSLFALWSPCWFWNHRGGGIVILTVVGRTGCGLCWGYEHISDNSIKAWSWGRCLRYKSKLTYSSNISFVLHESSTNEPCKNNVVLIPGQEKELWPSWGIWRGSNE